MAVSNQGLPESIQSALMVSSALMSFCLNSALRRLPHSLLACGTMHACIVLQGSEICQDPRDLSIVCLGPADWAFKPAIKSARATSLCADP